MPADHVIVLFGATGDLAARRLLPGLFHLAVSGLLPDGYRIVGTSRRELTDAEFRACARAAIDHNGRHEAMPETWERFERRLSYASSDVGRAEALAAAVARAERELGGDAARLYYLSVPPAAMSGIVATLGETGLADGARVIMEKPFGTDLPSALALNDAVHSVFEESQIFRIDHFLGKEAVQNILALRFANGLFEPVWNRDRIDHVQIDVPETLSIEGRAAFYEPTGAFRDMIVTHLFQVLGFVAMEPPTSLDAVSIQEEKNKVFQAMKPLDRARVVRGQYEGYREEPGVDPASETETFVALEVEIDNWRWADVPFFLRTGKRLPAQRRCVTVVFREPPLRMFGVDGFRPDELVLDFAEPGGISIEFLAKVPGPKLRLGPARMRFDYTDSFCEANQLEAYERLIHDAMVGDRTLFTSARGIERVWQVSTPVLEDPPPLRSYPAGSWGPAAADELIAPRAWHLTAAAADTPGRAVSEGQPL
jgi:glucose-6-phosphate 1-dehydrogenase